jgi:DNA end-binding protein Ku
VPKPHRYAHPKRSDGEQTPQGPRPTWRGHLSFGLVTIPVELYPASRPASLRAHSVTEDGVRLARKYYCPNDEQALEAEDLVRGYEVAKDEYVVVDDAELEALAPKKSREIELRLFTDRDGLHPALFENPYVLAPARDKTAGKAYRLLAHVMHEKARAGIATFVLHEREYIIAIVSDGELLLGETLRFADELRSSADVDLPAAQKPQAALVSKFTRALEAKAKGHFDPKKLIDPAHENLAKLLEAKRRKGEVLKPPTDSAAAESTAAAEGGEVIDLMRLLKQSLQQQPSASAKTATKTKTKAKPRTRQAHAH